MYLHHSSESAGATARLYVSEQFDSDGEVSIQLTNDETISGYFTRANLVELRDHLDYLLTGRRSNAEPRVITESLIRELARDEAKNVVREYHTRVANLDV